MNIVPRIIELKSSADALQELIKIQCDQTGASIMTSKALFRVLKVENISAKGANLLKQAFLSKGGDVAIARGCANLSVEHSDVLIMATLKQYRLALPQLKMQPWGLAKVANDIERVLDQQDAFPLRKYGWPKHQLTIEKGRTLVMGILNITPDSFSDGGRFFNLDAALYHLEEMVKDGADIIDVGAESTRPYGNSEKVSAEEEMNRLLPVLEKVLEICPVPVSIDTYKAVVAREALKLGAHIINDVWGMQYDPDMPKVAAQFNVPVVVMHNQLGTNYERDIMSHICEFLNRSIEIGIEAGVDRDNIIVDPGIGFGKTSAQNLTVMSRLEELQSLGCPILLGSSRKKFIGEILGAAVEERMEGTGATAVFGIQKGVNIVRVHDVKPIAKMVKVADAMLREAF